MGFEGHWLMGHSYMIASNGRQHMKNRNVSHFCPVAGPTHSRQFRSC